jgi:hypothetical protein
MMTKNEEINQRWHHMVNYLDNIGIKPCGYHLIVHAQDFDDQLKEKSIIEVPDEFKDKERAGTDCGTVLMIGPQCYIGYDGVSASMPIPAANQWGVQQGSFVEFNRYDGKASAIIRNYMSKNDIKKGHNDYDFLSSIKIIHDNKILSAVNPGVMK